MLEREKSVYKLLDTLNIAYYRHAHAPVYTTADCAEIDAELDGMHCKNLFLCTRNESAFYLLVIEKSKKFHTGNVSRAIGASRLQLGSAQRLMEKLGVEPGAVSPFGLLHNRDRDVTLYMDADLRSAEKVSFHPCVNTASIVLPRVDFLRVLGHLGVEPRYISID